MKKIIAFVITLIGLVVTVFFIKYNGTKISYSYLYLIGGIVLTIIGIRLINRSNRLNNHKNNFTIDNSILLNIDLLRCLVIENAIYVEEQTKFYNNSVILLDYIYNKGEPTKTIKKTECRVLCKQAINGIEHLFVSDIIYKDKETILLHFIKQKNTALYISKLDNSQYYFDLDFLSN